MLFNIYDPIVLYRNAYCLHYCLPIPVLFLYDKNLKYTFVINYPLIVLFCFLGGLALSLLHLANPMSVQHDLLQNIKIGKL